MSFTKQKSLESQVTETKSENSIVSTIANYLPMLTLVFEQMTGQSIPQSKGTLADIQITLQQILSKIDNLERNCAEQFQLQETQLNSLQQVSKLVQETKSITFTKPKQLQIED